MKLGMDRRAEYYTVQHRGSSGQIITFNPYKLPLISISIPVNKRKFLLLHLAHPLPTLYVDNRELMLSISKEIIICVKRY